MGGMHCKHFRPRQAAIEPHGSGGISSCIDQRFPSILSSACYSAFSLRFATRISGMSSHIHTTTKIILRKSGYPCTHIRLEARRDEGFKRQEVGSYTPVSLRLASSGCDGQRIRLPSSLLSSPQPGAAMRAYRRVVSCLSLAPVAVGRRLPTEFGTLDFDHLSS